MSIDLKPIREALEFYAESFIKVDDPPMNTILWEPAMEDRGAHARRALAHLDAIEQQPTDRVSLAVAARAIRAAQYDDIAPPTQTQLDNQGYTDMAIACAKAWGLNWKS